MRVSCSLKQQEKAGSKEALGEPLQVPPSLLRPRTGQTKRSEVAGVPGAFVVDGLLSEEECASLVAQTEQRGFRPLDKEFLAHERNNERVMVLDSELGHWLYERLQPCLTDDDVLFIQPTGFGNQGVWRPSGLNACLKFGKYVEGQLFAPHYDGPWVPRDDESSIYTLMVYLSTLPEGCGGETRFFSDANEPIASVAPVAGRAVVFFHDTMHSGAPITMAGVAKYVLRTEVMFLRINTSEIANPRAYETLPEYKRLVSVYTTSQEAFAKGDVVGFTAGYQEAIALQRGQARPAQAQRFGRGQLPFPTDVCIMILQKLDLLDVMACSSVSRTFRELSQDNRIWRGLFRAYFTAFPLPDSAPPFFQRHLKLQGSDTLKRASQMRAELEAGDEERDFGEQEDEGNMLLQAMRAKRVGLRRDASIKSFYLKFRRETNILRHNCPVLVVDCLGGRIIVGIQGGADNQGHWRESCDSIAATCCKISSGESHYRSVHFYYGEDCAGLLANRNAELVKICDDAGNLVDSYAISEYLWKKSSRTDFMVFIKPLDAQTNEPGHKLLRATAAVPVSSARSKLLLRHYGANEKTTLIVERHKQVTRLWKNGKFATVTAKETMGELKKFEPYDSIIFSGMQTFGEFEKSFPSKKKVLNCEATAEAREMVAVKACMAVMRNICTL